MRAICWIVAFLNALSVSGSAAETREFATAAAEAEKKFDTTEGHDYAVKLMRSVAPALVEAMHACNNSDFKAQSIYDLVFVVSSSGTIERVLSTPTNPFAHCIAIHVHFPDSVAKPPKASWPVQIRVLHGRRLQEGPDPPFIIFSDDPRGPFKKT